MLHAARQKIGSKSANNAVIYRGVAPSQAKNCVNTSVSASKSCQNTAIYSVSCLPRFCLKLQKHCKYQHFLRSTRQKCCNLQCFFLLGFQTHWYLQCFVHLGSKKYWYLQHFLRLCMAPANDVKTQKCCNLQHFVTSEKRKIIRKMCQNGIFFRF